MTKIQRVKYIFPILLALIFTASLAACSDDDTRHKTKDADVSSDTGGNGDSGTDSGEDVSAGEDADSDSRDADDTIMDVQDDVEVVLVPIGEACACQWGGMEGSGTRCDECEGERCYQSFDLSEPPYCTRECDQFAAGNECADLGEDWVCDGYLCSDASREP